MFGEFWVFKLSPFTWRRDAWSDLLWFVHLYTEARGKLRISCVDAELDLLVILSFSEKGRRVSVGLLVGHVLNQVDSANLQQQPQK